MVALAKNSISTDWLINAALGRPNAQATTPSTVELIDIVDWAHQHFYIDRNRTIRLEPHQQRILRHFTEQKPDGRFKWKTLIYSAPKKSGKTAVSALYARWAAETWGMGQEVYNLGNKQAQAKERAFKAARQSIRFSPQSLRNQWLIKELTLTYLPNESVIQALPVSDTGEAGSNPSLTVWTELWGFEHEAARRFWDELQPVPTRQLSQRFVDTYAGYEGESMLLWELWQLALEGERLDDEVPLYGNEQASLCAYLDQGPTAWRMAWQTPEYYAEAEKTERPINYNRLHLNLWVSRQMAFINIAHWDSLRYDALPSIGGVVLGVDAAISGDSTAVSVVTIQEGVIYELETHVFYPPTDAKLDYMTTLKPCIEGLLRRYRVVGVAYDEYQLHNFMKELEKLHAPSDARHPTKPNRERFFYAFPQGLERIKADTALLSNIQQDQFRHSGGVELRSHVENADGKEERSGEGIRIVKRRETGKIDGLVALSMAAWRGVDLLDRMKAAPLLTRVHSGNLYKPLKVRDRS